MVRRRCGFTLLELLIVLAILVVVLSMAWPSMRKLSQKGQLQNAARRLRIQLLEARLDAIQSGNVLFFRYQPGTGSYEVSSSSDFGTVDQLGLVTPGDAANDDPLSNRDLGDDMSPQTELPDNIVFVDPVVGATMDPAGDGLADRDASRGWSAPVVFYPNGRTLNARFRLEARRYAVDLSLRGLTGTVTIGQVQRLEAEDNKRLEDL